MFKSFYNLYKKHLKEIIRFVVVGGFCFLLEFAMLYGFTEYLHIQYLISSAAAFIIALIVNYFLCVYVVFNTENQSNTKRTWFVITSVAGLGINQIVMYIMVEKIAIWYMFAKVFAAAVVMIWNYITKKIILR